MSLLLHIPEISYESYLELKTKLHDQKNQHLIEDLWLISSHRPGVFTCGRSFSNESLLIPKESIIGSGRDIHNIERGGDITYHGPSQIMIYPFIEVPNHDIEHLVRNLEKVILATLDSYGLAGELRKGLPGVWCNGSKIASIGVAVRKWITTHGLAFNHYPDDGGFSMIVPCGIRDVTMTSLVESLKREIKRSEVIKTLENSIISVFNINLKKVDYNDLIDILNVEI